MFMIPSVTGYLDEDIEVEIEPSKNYKMDLSEGGDSVRGFCDKIEAMKQTVFRILQTERYAFTIYSNDYGIETMDLYGMPVTYVCPELERRITEALMMDDRIEDVTDFEFDTSTKRNVHVSFTVVTIFGDFQAEREVNITNE